MTTRKDCAARIVRSMDVRIENYATDKVRPSSHQTYRGCINNHVKPDSGSIPLSNVTSLELMKFYKKPMGTGRVERIESKKRLKELSAKTVRNINQIIVSAQKEAAKTMRGILRVAMDTML